MSAEHQRPLFAFVVLTVVCGLFMGSMLRAQDIVGMVTGSPVGPVSIVAAGATLEVVHDLDGFGGGGGVSSPGAPEAEPEADVEPQPEVRPEARPEARPAERRKARPAPARPAPRAAARPTVPRGEAKGHAKRVEAKAPARPGKAKGHTKRGTAKAHARPGKAKGHAKGHAKRGRRR